MKPQTIFNLIFEGEVSPRGRAMVPASPGRMGEQRFCKSKIATSLPAGDTPATPPSRTSGSPSWEPVHYLEKP
ncbi:MAG: hypothetical protein LBK13_12480 [Spirochaetales bacterium]|jgi:hypothetical protein|nr:hypothetical protein [Spirochaetales bacterium]